MIADGSLDFSLMYSRKYSLKTRYSFRNVLKSENSYSSKFLLIKYKRADFLKFGIITSNKFCKKAVVQNKIRRYIAGVIQKNLSKFPKNYNFIFIPKKTVLFNDKVSINAKEIDFEVNTFLSKVVFT